MRRCKSLLFSFCLVIDPVKTHSSFLTNNLFINSPVHDGVSMCVCVCVCVCLRERERKREGVCVHDGVCVRELERKTDSTKGGF